MKRLEKLNKEDLLSSDTSDTIEHRKELRKGNCINDKEVQFSTKVHRGVKLSRQEC